MAASLGSPDRGIVRRVRHRRQPVASSAVRRSVTRSAVVSIPTESRTRAGSTSSGEPAADACVMRPGVLDQRLDRAERLTEREEAGALDDGEGGGLTPGGEERDHPAEVAHLPGRGVVARVPGEARIEDAPDGGMGPSIATMAARSRSGDPCGRRGSSPRGAPGSSRTAPAPRRPRSAGSRSVRRIASSFTADDPPTTSE